jgi:hypothetical protein
MMKSFAGRLLAGLAALTPAAAFAQGKVASMVPAQPQTVTVVDSYGGCTQNKMLFIGILFQVWSDDGRMIRVAEQAASAYADPSNLIKFDDGHRMIRAIEVRDYAGLQGFLRSIMDDESLDMDVMIVAIPSDKRFASVDEQIDGWEEIYLADVVELGAEPCSKRR